jgi:alcohol dehydrogenase
MMFNNLEIIGNFMHVQSAYLPLLSLVRAGQLDMSPIKPKAFSMPDLAQAMDYASKARSLELVVITSATGRP